MCFWCVRCSATSTRPRSSFMTRCKTGMRSAPMTSSCLCRRSAPALAKVMRCCSALRTSRKSRRRSGLGSASCFRLAAPPAPLGLLTYPHLLGQHGLHVLPQAVARDLQTERLAALATVDADLTDTNVQPATRLGAPFKIYSGDISPSRGGEADRHTVRAGYRLPRWP